MSRHGHSAFYHLGPLRFAFWRGPLRPGFEVGWYREDGKLDWNFSLFGR